MKEKMAKMMGDKLKLDMEAVLKKQKEEHQRELDEAQTKLSARIAETSYSIDDF